MLTRYVLKCVLYGKSARILFAREREREREREERRPRNFFRVKVSYVGRGNLEQLGSEAAVQKRGEDKAGEK